MSYRDQLQSIGMYDMCSGVVFGSQQACSDANGCCAVSAPLFLTQTASRAPECRTRQLSRSIRLQDTSIPSIDTSKTPAISGQDSPWLCADSNLNRHTP